MPLFWNDFWQDMAINGIKIKNFSLREGNPLEPGSTTAAENETRRTYLRQQRQRRSPRTVQIIISIVAAVAVILAFIPWYASYLRDKSLRQAEQGYQIDALHTAESAASWNPLSIEGMFVLAGAQQRIGYADEARKTLQKAVRMEPLNYAAWEQLAIYERDYWNMPAQAHRDFVKASSLNPYDKELRQEGGLPPLAGANH